MNTPERPDEFQKQPDGRFIAGPPLPELKPKKGLNPVWVLLACGLLIALIVGGYTLFRPVSTPGPEVLIADVIEEVIADNPTCGPPGMSVGLRTDTFDRAAVVSGLKAQGFTDVELRELQAKTPAGEPIAIYVLVAIACPAPG